MFSSILEIEQANAAAGHHWFDLSSMRFFDSRVSETVYPVSDGALFVSSERESPSAPRLYTIRFVHGVGEKRGHVETVGEFQQFRSRSGAHGAAYRLAAGWLAWEIEQS